MGLWCHGCISVSGTEGSEFNSRLTPFFRTLFDSFISAQRSIPWNALPMPNLVKARLRSRHSKWTSFGYFPAKKMHHWRWANMPWSFTLTGEDQAVVLSIVNGKLPILLCSLFLVLDMLRNGRLGSLSLAPLNMAYPDVERCVCLMIYSVLVQD